jgi:hypothetical protein
MVEHAASTAIAQSVGIIQNFWRHKRAARMMTGNANL